MIPPLLHVFILLFVIPPLLHVGASTTDTCLELSPELENSSVGLESRDETLVIVGEAQLSGMKNGEGKFADGSLIVGVGEIIYKV